VADEIEIICRAVREIEINCPVCGEDRSNIWVKDIRNGRLLYKCGNCAYVNTTNPMVVGGLPSVGEYTNIVEGDKVVGITFDGKTHVLSSDYPLFGREFHGINLSPQVPRDIKCPVCGGKTKFYRYNPFIRNVRGIKQYRCDVHYMCENNRDIAFGVHITEEDFLALRLHKEMDKKRG